MTRETKVGLVVAGSFLCLVGVVIASRLGGTADTQQPDSAPPAVAAKQEPAVKQEAAPKQVAAALEKKEPAPDNKKKTSEVVQVDLKGVPSAPAVKVTEPGAFPMPSAQSIQPAPLFPPASAPPAVAEDKKKSPLEDGEHESIKKLIKENKEKEAASQAATAKIPGKPDDLPLALPLPTVDGVPVAIPAPPPTVKKDNELPPPPLNGLHSPPSSAFVGPIQEHAAPVAEASKPPVIESAGPVALADPATSVKQKETLPPLPPNAGLPANPMNVPAPPPVVKQELPIAPAKDARPTNLPPIPAVNPAPPPTQIAMNKELTNPNLPPLGSEFKNPTPAVVPATSVKPASSTGPKVIDFNVESYECTPDDTSFAAVSTRKFGSPKYAKALLQYNRQHPLAAKENILQQDNPRLQPRQIVFIPPAQFLEDRFASLIDNRPSTPAPPPAPAVTINAPVNANTATRAPNPVPTTDATKAYRVAGQGQMLIEIAQQTLGDRGRWSEIYRLNPSVRPEYPIPGGTEIRLPANANVP